MIAEKELIASEGGGDPRPWTRDDYYRAAECGIFGPDEKLELIRGEVIKKASPQKSTHATGLLRAMQALLTACQSVAHVRPQLPLTIDDASEPEPDLALVAGDPSQYAAAHPKPSDALLVVEIADTSLQIDRTSKAALYAQAGIGEYWIIDLRGNRLIVHRRPEMDASSRFGYAYGDVRTLYAGDVVSALRLPESSLAVSDLLSPAVLKA